MILSSPFEAFNRYEATNGLPRDFIRRSTRRPRTRTRGPGSSAARSTARSSTPRSPTSPSGSAIGSAAATCSALLAGEVRPEMVVALDRVMEAGYTTACLTNNVVGGEAPTTRRRSPSWPGSTTSSSRARSACASPSRRSTRWRASSLGVTPQECVFLDDLGINLKPAAAMGMTTIKVDVGRPGDHRPRSRPRHPAALIEPAARAPFVSPTSARIAGAVTQTGLQAGEDLVHEVGELLVVDRLASRWRGCRTRRGRRGAGRSPAP